MSGDIWVRMAGDRVAPRLQAPEPDPRAGGVDSRLVTTGRGSAAIGSGVRAQRMGLNRFSEGRHSPRSGGDGFKLAPSVSPNVRRSEEERAASTVGEECPVIVGVESSAREGHDEKSSLSNRGNFLEFLDVLTMYNDELSKAIAKAPKNAKYTSHDIQKQILHLISMRVKNVIREEIGVAKYCIIVDESRDESKRANVYSIENVIYSTLAHYNLDVQNIRGQGYDGASNMRVVASKNVTPIHQFFDRLTFIVNIVGSSCKRNDELKNAHADDIAHLIAINELETGRGLNPIGTLQRAADTRCSSHLKSLKGLIKMFSASYTVLFKVMDDGLPFQRADATSVYDEMTSFDFVFILHLMNEIMGITDILYQALQSKSQDIINAMELVLSTKNLLQHMRDNKWNDVLAKVKSFCEDEPAFVKTISPLSIIISNALNPQNVMESFKIKDICKLVEKFYAQDFTKDVKEQLEMQMKHYEYNVVKGPDYKNLSTISELCQCTLYSLVFMQLESLLTWKVEGLDSREFDFVTFTCSEEASVAICGMDGKLPSQNKYTGLCA
ncbi:uncharacterized protein LOC122010977 [Zingiber officinale]|uniref:uncharacterized protein LOC122010977 n=1 Tax=Zingiber officinale TaxID=94328 RepID=UPI001C4CD877|nr:uncharacterized protein LOC122010977 [Zingiber officinale]